jgi:hypothetical protein
MIKTLPSGYRKSHSDTKNYWVLSPKSSKFQIIRIRSVIQNCSTSKTLFIIFFKKKCRSRNSALEKLRFVSLASYLSIFFTASASLQPKNWSNSVV